LGLTNWGPGELRYNPAIKGYDSILSVGVAGIGQTTYADRYEQINNSG